MFNLTPPTTRLSAADRNPDALCLQVWTTASVGEPAIATAPVVCMFTGRTFGAGSTVRAVRLDDGREGVMVVGVFGSPSTIHGDEFSTTACHDVTRFAEYAERPDCRSVTLFTKAGEPTTYRRDGAAWLKWGRTKTSAATLARLAAKSSAFAASR
jgi:hypothetical protein